MRHKQVIEISLRKQIAMQVIYPNIKKKAKGMPWFLSCFFRLSSSAVFYIAEYVELFPSVPAKREKEGRALPCSPEPVTKQPLHMWKPCNNTFCIPKHSSPGLAHQTSDTAYIQVSSCHNCNHGIYWHSDCVRGYVYAHVLIWRLWYAWHSPATNICILFARNSWWETDTSHGSSLLL